MNIQLPKYHYLQKCSNLKELGQYLRTWEIGVPFKDSLEWSIVMAYLSTTYFSKDDEFKSRIMMLSDCCDIDFNDIKDCFSRFNPFLNRYGCFYNKCLRRVMTAFKEKLQETLSRNCMSGDLTSKLEITSNLLKSSIALVITTNNGDIETVKSFPNVSDAELLFETNMTLYHCNWMKLSRFHFGMKKEKGNELRRAACIKVLKQANIYKKRRSVLFSLDKGEESFVTSVLKSDCRSSITNLYKSSYHAWKLAEAGFEMDPRVADSNGCSALYYALMAGEDNLLYVLHNYAANACHSLEKTYRDPDVLILDNLINLGEIIAKDIKNSGYLDEQSEDAKAIIIRAKQLIRFNEFLIEMCKNILKAQKIDMDDAPSEVIETTIRKNVMLALLQTYDSFFFYDNNEVCKNNTLPLDSYSKYDCYYRNVDYSATLFFFDNIFFLKERLRLEFDEYSELESSFFLSVLSNKYFSKEIFKSNFFVNRHSDYQKCFDGYVKTLLRSPEKVKLFKFIPLLERLCLRQQMKRFTNTLEAVDLPNNILGSIPSEEVLNTFVDLPEVKDELVICRLIHYLKVALEQSMTSVKQSLIIERALQVLGEILVYGSQHRTSLCFFIFAAIPEGSFRILKQTRNILSHLNEYSFTPKFKVEKNYSFFRDIQTNVRNIFEAIQGIFDLQQLRLAEFIFRRGLGEIQGSLSIPENKGLVLSSDELSEALMQLEKEYKTVCEIKCIPSYRNAVYKDQNIIKNLMETTEAKLKDDTLWCHESVLKNVQEVLWPLKYFLTLIAKDNADTNSKIEKVINDSDEIFKSSVDHIKEKTEEFWKKYKALISELEMTVLPKTSEKRCEMDGTNKFKKILRGASYLSQDEKNDIRSRIPENIITSVNLKNEIQNSLESGNPLTYEQIYNFPKNLLTKKYLSKLKKTDTNDSDEILEIIKAAEDPIASLNSILDGNKEPMKKEAFQKLCDRMQFTGDIKDKLLNLTAGKAQLPAENNLSNILNRIKLLREILIDDNPNIHELWSNAKHSKTKEYARYKIVQRFIRDPEVQLSVEMLLFDCMIMLGNEIEIESLWIKAHNLFSGINLRNVLGHGNPTLENIGKLLDPDDLPSGLVNEMLNLIEDEAGIEAMHRLCLEAKLDFDQFHVLINDEENTEYLELRQVILDTKENRWKRYSKLLPLTKNVNASFLRIGHSASIECEECERDNSSSRESF